VLAKAKRVVVRHEKASFEARLDLWDTARDLCQLRAAGLPAALVRIAPTASVVVGQNVYVQGDDGTLAAFTVRPDEQQT